MEITASRFKLRANAAEGRKAISYQLVNIGPVALMQDLAADAALGIASVERNGHHYFRGLSIFPQHISKAVLAAHGDLFTPMNEFARLDVRNGEIQVGTINSASFGTDVDLSMADFEPVTL